MQASHVFRRTCCSWSELPIPVANKRFLALAVHVTTPRTSNYLVLSRQPCLRRFFRCVPPRPPPTGVPFGFGASCSGMSATEQAVSFPSAKRRCWDLVIVRKNACNGGEKAGADVRENTTTTVVIVVGGSVGGAVSSCLETTNSGRKL